MLDKLAWLVWGLFAVLFICQVPLMFMGERAAKLMARCFGLLGFAGLGVTYFYSFSPFHLLWWAPISLVATMILAQAYVGGEVRALIKQGSPEPSTPQEVNDSAEVFLQDFEAFSELNSVLKTLAGQVAEGTAPRKAFLLNYADQLEHAFSRVQKLDMTTSRLPEGHILGITASKGTVTAANAIVDAASSVHEMAQRLLTDALERQIEYVEAQLANVSSESIELRLELEEAQMVEKTANEVVERASTVWDLAEAIGQKYAVAANGEA